jgi:F-type H+-transporting ATPase subunit O
MYYHTHHTTSSPPLTISNVLRPKLTNFHTQKLDDKTLRRLETAIGKSEYSQGKKLKVTSKVNPDILGGLIVEIGERTMDLSVSSKINRLNKMLTDTV